MTAYVSSGLMLAKRRRVLAAAEVRLRRAIRAHSPVPARVVEGVRQGHLSYLKALVYELQTGTDIDAVSQRRLAAAIASSAAWESATSDQITSAYGGGLPIAPGDVPATFAAST